MDRVDTYRRAYDEMAEQLEASGNPTEATEHRRLAGQCRKLKREMELLAQAEATTYPVPETTVLSGPNLAHLELVRGKEGVAAE